MIADKNGTHEHASDVKLTFRLSEDQIGPFPIAVESLWCAVEGKFFRVKNIPFFIDGVSFDDLIEVSGKANDCYEIAKVVGPSNNCTIWILTKDVERGAALLEELGVLGCGIEGGVFPDYFAVNVPMTTDLDKVLSVIQDCEQSGWVAVDYPSIRRESALL